MTDLRVRFDPKSFDVSHREHANVQAPRGTTISCKGWQQEAALRMLMNNLDPDVAERPDDLVVYGGTGKAARNWECFDAIVRELKMLDDRVVVERPLDLDPLDGVTGHAVLGGQWVDVLLVGAVDPRPEQP